MTTMPMMTTPVVTTIVGRSRALLDVLAARAQDRARRPR
jgi:hypothetical protein